MDGFAADISEFTPRDVVLQADSEVAVLDDATGEIFSYLSYPDGTPHQSAATAVYSAASGAVIEWKTSAVIAGRILRGRTFVVPLASTSYQSDGTLAADTVTGLATAATTVADGTPVLQVWHRPTAKAAADGVAWPVTSVRVPDFAAVLRSRRD